MLTTTGELDTERLLHAFMDFWLQHGEALLQSAAYPEIAPHLVLMAFLHRVINGGGSLEREYAIGRDQISALPLEERLKTELVYTANGQQVMVIQL